VGTIHIVVLVVLKHTKVYHLFQKHTPVNL
jgi:hypothetical protein